MSPRFWLVVALTGVGAGIAGAALMLVLYTVQHLAFGYTELDFLHGVEQASALRRVIVLAVAGLLGGTAWWALRRWMRPSPGVSEAVWSPHGRMRIVPAALDGLVQIVVVGMGASLGREGAPRQVGATIASTLGDLTGLPARQRRLLIACGAGAGLAAVYNVPFGGAVFTLEVLLGSLALPLVIPAALTCVIATMVAWVVLGDRATYTVAAFPLTGSLIVFAVLAGPLCGLAGVGFVRLVAWSKARTPHGWRLPLATTGVFTALGGLAIAYPQLLGNGKGPAQLAFDGGGGLVLLATLVVLKPVATAACLRSGATGGLFTPVLATGALLGGVLGHGWVLLWPGTPLGAFAVVGAAALLAAALQAPVSAVILILELTQVGQTALVPIVLAVLGASLTARILEDRSTYTIGLPDTADGPPTLHTDPVRATRPSQTP